MSGETLLKLVTVLTPDDVKQMRDFGCVDEVAEVLKALDKLMWWLLNYGWLEDQLITDISTRLNELKAVLREG